jgi:hypothetical protein
VLPGLSTRFFQPSSLPKGFKRRGKKVVHLGTIVDDLEAPTWPRRKASGEEGEPVPLEKAWMPN